MPFNASDFKYEVVPGWGKLPSGMEWGTVSSLACDSKDRVYVYCRGDQPIKILDRDGNFLDSWGEGIIKMPHGLYIDKDDNVWCSDRDAHCIYKFNPQGKLVMTLGNPGTAGQNGEPFNIPTDVCVAPSGEIFVSDGYGNRRVHKYSADGKLLMSWGVEGKGPGEFTLVHSVRIDRYGKVWICDRDALRIQIFDQNGKYLKEWSGMNMPAVLYFHPTEDVVFIAELFFFVSIYTLDGEFITKWGTGKTSDKPGEFLGWPHGIWRDSRGDLYVGEVNTQNRIQKFALKK
jgi:streptogramin lyase